jgi:hypothetical protein
MSALSCDLPLFRVADLAPVRNYRNLAITAFRNTARSCFWELVARGWMEDWKQECELAAWQAQSARMRLNEAVRFCNRACYRFLRSIGMRKPTNGRRMVWTDTAVPSKHFAAIEGPAQPTPE